MIYFNSRYLSDQLSVNLAKWKRWTREFLSPDPLGGLQSGYARQFNYKEAFRVYLGGQLVSVLRFSIHETRHILNDIDPVLKKLGFYALNPQNDPAQFQDQWLLIYLLPNGNLESSIQPRPDTMSHSKSLFGRILNVGKIYGAFLEKLGE